MARNILKIISTIIIFILSVSTVLAQNLPVIEFFWAHGCPHCAKEKIFLHELKNKYPNLEIREYEISTSMTNSMLLEAKGRSLHADVSGVPFTVIGDKYVSGYQSDEITGKQIESLLSMTDDDNDQSEQNNQSLTLNFLFFKEIDIASLSLPLLTLVLAIMDGFNPCAMWALIFLLSLLIGMDSHTRRYLLGSLFIITSGLVYFLFLSAWLNLFLFVGMIPVVRMVIAGLALYAGWSYLVKYFKKNDSCSVSSNKEKQVFLSKLKQVMQSQSLLLASFGVIGLSFLVNLVEFVCSAGLPAIYTHILSISNLSSWQYYGYLLFYVLIFILDDLLVFGIAMTTLKTTGLKTKYSHITRFVGGILLVIIGFLLLFRPSLLMLG